MDACDPARICTLSRDELGDRLKAWKSLNRASLASESCDEEGLTLTYRRSEESERTLDELVRLEQICCGDGGLHFSVSKQEETLTLRVTLPGGIDQVREAVEILKAFASS